MLRRGYGGGMIYIGIRDMGVGRGLSEKGFDSLRFFLSMCMCVGR